VSRSLILASGSPQRRAILDDLGLAFEVQVSDVAEEEAGAPRAVASENALRKAQAVAARVGPGALVVGCDTLVATDGAGIADHASGLARSVIWGKPADAGDAVRTLRHLSGRTHEVVSGLALVADGAVRTAIEVTEVTFRALSDAEIDWYVATGEWQGRAGAYAIQQRGAVLVNRIAGDYLNVVGLPVAALLALEPDLQAAYVREDR
jgi:septum formation protein